MKMGKTVTAGAAALIVLACGKNPQEFQPWPDGAELWLLNVYGVPADTALAWSPYGHVLLFCNNGSIYGHSGSGNPSRRTFTPLNESTGPNGCWNATNFKIVFSAVNSSTGAGEIRTIPGNGTSLKLLLSVDRPVAFPTWNPAGDSLVFSMQTSDSQHWRLFTMAYQTDSLTPEDVPIQIPLPPGDCVRPSYSHDGSLILFQHRESPGEPWSIWITTPDGSQAEPVAQEGNCIHPGWSPYPGWFVFSTDRWGHFQIAAAHIQGDQFVRVTNDPGTDLYPAWNPSFGWIAFSSDRIEGEMGYSIFSITEPALPGNP